MNRNIWNSHNKAFIMFESLTYGKFSMFSSHVNTGGLLVEAWTHSNLIRDLAVVYSNKSILLHTSIITHSSYGFLINNFLRIHSWNMMSTYCTYVWKEDKKRLTTDWLTIIMKSLLFDFFLYYIIIISVFHKRKFVSSARIF